ncbi:Hypothetical predicted protein, partial [Paramuricea clavata]
LCIRIESTNLGDVSDERVFGTWMTHASNPGAPSVCIQDRQHSNPTKLRQRRYPQTAERQDVRAMDNIAETDYSDHSDEVGVFRINVNNMTSDRNKHPLFDVTIEGTLLTIMADSDSSISILDEQDYNKLSPRPSLEQTRIKVYPYQTETPLPVLGQFTSTVASEIVNRTETFYVVKGTTSQSLAQPHRRVPFHIHLLEVIITDEFGEETITSFLTSEQENAHHPLPHLFQGLGKLKDYHVQLHIDEGVPPVSQPHRRVPFHVRKQLEEQLSQDEKLGVIECEEGSTPLVSPIVVAPKPKSPGKVRVCVDMRRANTAVQRKRHITPTIKEIIGDLNGATVFSKLDLNQGYNQLELAPESRYITTFSTHPGLMRYKRLNFGICCAAEIFQNSIRESLDGIPGAINIILVFGKTRKEHDQALAAVFQRLRECGLTLNKLKCEYSKNSLEFFGYVFGADGMAPDPKKVQDILNLKAPTTMPGTYFNPEKTNEISVDASPQRYSQTEREALATTSPSLVSMATRTRNHLLAPFQSHRTLQQTGKSCRRTPFNQHVSRYKGLPLGAFQCTPNIGSIFYFRFLLPINLTVTNIKPRSAEITVELETRVNDTHEATNVNKHRSTNPERTDISRSTKIVVRRAMNDTQRRNHILERDTKARTVIAKTKSIFSRHAPLFAIDSPDQVENLMPTTITETQPKATKKTRRLGADLG